MLKIEFYDRKKEIGEFLNILNTQPNLITFVYGPINSGKTELINYLTSKLSENFVVFYVNLRERMIRDFNDLIEALFEINVGKRKAFAKELIAEITKFAGIPISKTLLDQFFKEDRPKDAFRYIVEIVKEVRAKNKMPVLIIDELQKIGDLKIDGYLIYELFNLFIRLTKELHCCHVFAVTSDSLFVERVYAEAMLQGRCRYLLVDDFDYNTTVEFLRKYDFSDNEIGLVWEYLGGKPVYLVEAVRIKRSGNLREFVEELLSIRISQIKDAIYELEEDDRELFKRVIELFGKFKEKEVIKYEKLSKEIRFCVRKNILFVEPVKRIIKPQSRLDLLAMRRIVGELKPNN